MTEPVKQIKIHDINSKMTVAEVQKNGTEAAKSLASIFDKDGSGKYEANEIEFIQNHLFSYDEKEVRFYSKDALLENGKLPKSKALGSIKREEEWQYEDRVKEYKFNKNVAPTLVKYGIDPENAQWVGITNAKVQTINGKQTLVLVANNPYEKYQLELPLDKDYEPSKILMYRSERSTSFENIRGTLRLLNNNSNEFTISGNSSVTVVGKTGAKDCIYMEDKAEIKFITNDYADVIVDMTRGETIHLKPGTTQVRAKEESNE